MPYHPPADFTEAVRDLVATAGGRAVGHTFGETVQGRSIRAVTVAAPERTPDPSRPHCVVLAGMHGVEVIGTEVALGILARLCAPDTDGRAIDLLQRSDVTVIPCLNLDGRARAFESLDSRRLWNSAWRSNAHGIDLNRNWPFPAGVEDHWLPIAGNGRSWTPWYRGPEPLSEPETRSLAEFTEQLSPFALLNLHSTAGLLTYPWSSKPQPPADQDGFESMAAAFKAAQTGQRYGSKQSRQWYPIIGSSNDWFYDTLGAMAMTVEISRTAESVKRDWRKWRWLFWWANPDDPDVYVNDDAEACLAALIAAHGYRYAE